MSYKRIGVDIDGVLANFCLAFMDLLVEVTGRDLVPESVKENTRTIPIWNWPAHYGYTREEEQRAWDRVKESDEFWQTLKAMPGATELLDQLNHVNGDVYFVTSRLGNSAKRQTETWLRFYGAWEPTVLVNYGNKGKIAQGLQLTHFIDDNADNCKAVLAEVPACSIYLLRCGYNAFYPEPGEDSKIIVVESIDQFTEKVLGRAA